MRRRRIYTLVAIPFLSILLAGRTFPFLEEFKKTFNEELKGNRITGAAYAVFSADTVYLNGGYGFADKKNEDAADVHDRFLIGSMTKIFTATAVCRLADAGKLNIDDSLKEYIREFRIGPRFPEAQNITIRQILSHHAGLPTDIYAGKYSQDPPSYERVLNYLEEHSACYEPGRIKCNSNLGYSLLGLLIEKVSGQSYEEYITRHILQPLGMDRSGFYKKAGTPPDLSKAYCRKGHLRKELPVSDVPAGGMYSTVNDMIRFGRALLDRDSGLLKPETLDDMFSLQNTDVPLDLDHGSGLCFSFRNKNPELGRVLEQGGELLYHKSKFYIAPDAGLAAVMLSNSPDGIKNAEKLQEELMPAIVSNDKIAVNTAKNIYKTFELTPIAGRDLEKFTGTYAMPGITSRMAYKHDHIYATISGQSFYLVPKDDKTFIPGKRILGKYFTLDKMWFHLEEIDGEMCWLESKAWGGFFILGQKIDPAPMTIRWKQRMGDYKIINQKPGEVVLLTNPEIDEANGLPVLRYTYHRAFGNDVRPELGLADYNDRTAYVLGLGRSGGESVRFFEDNGNTHFEYMGLIFRKIK